MVDNVRDPEMAIRVKEMARQLVEEHGAEIAATIVSTFDENNMGLIFQFHVSDEFSEAMGEARTNEMFRQILCSLNSFLRVSGNGRFRIIMQDTVENVLLIPEGVDDKPEEEGIIDATNSLH